MGSLAQLGARSTRNCRSVAFAILICAQTHDIVHLAGFSAFTRSTLFGGFYELLDHANGFTPNPSWWLGAILNKQIFSFPSAGLSGSANGRVWTYKATSSLPTLRAFVFSTGEVVAEAKTMGARNVALLVNLANVTVEVKLSLSPPIMGASAGSRFEWELTTAGDLHSQQVLLNGASSPLAMGTDGSVDPSVWSGLAKPVSEPIVVAPFAVKIVSQQ
eukprot:COSAG02_NODE_6977_length_3254_cov_2.047544_2_plen_217_part_00